jgi:hypothetical protein
MSAAPAAPIAGRLANAKLRLDTGRAGYWERPDE